LEVDATSATQDDELVPAGSTFAGLPGYTTAYVFTYTIELDPNLTQTFDLDVQVYDILIGGVPYNVFIENHGLLYFDISIENVGALVDVDYLKFTHTSGGSPNGNDLTAMYVEAAANFTTTDFAPVSAAISPTHDTVVVTVTVHLAPNDFEQQEPHEYDLAEAYTALAGKAITFSVGFELIVS
jgi:hypothetical protein